jgi:hypothetical protein
MDFKTLHETIPHAMGKKLHVLTMKPYKNITLALPGRHQRDTEVIGGDFVVMVTDAGMRWRNHQFTHVDLFSDLQKKKDQLPTGASFVMELDGFMSLYLDIIKGHEADYGLGQTSFTEGTLHPQTFLYAVQCLAVAEHRRYAKFERQYGGRYLPFRFGAGIVEGLWTDKDAAQQMRRGRPGVEQLERERGVPILTKELFA